MVLYTILATLAVLDLAAVTLLLLQLSRAPKGYEDEKGFHWGEDERPVGLPHRGAWRPSV